MVKIQSNMLAIAGIIVLVVGIAFMGYNIYYVTAVPAGLQDKNGDYAINWHDADVAHKWLNTTDNKYYTIAGPDGEIDSYDTGYIGKRFEINSTSPLWDGGVGDLDDSGTIDQKDLDIVIAFFGEGHTLSLFAMFNPMTLVGKVTYAGLIMTIAGVIITCAGLGFFKFKTK